MSSNAEREVERYLRPKNFNELPFHKEVVVVGEMPMVIGSWGSFETAEEYLNYYQIIDEKIKSAIQGSGFEARWGNHREYNVFTEEHDVSMAEIIVASTLETLAAKAKIMGLDKLEHTELVITSATTSLESVYYAKEILQRKGIVLGSVTLMNQACNGVLTAMNNTLLNAKYYGKVTTVVGIEQISGNNVDYSDPNADQTAFFFGNGVFATTYIPGVDLENADPEQAVTRVRADHDAVICIHNPNIDAIERTNNVVLPEELQLPVIEVVQRPNQILVPPTILSHYRLAGDDLTLQQFGVYEWNGIEVINMTLPQNEQGVKMVPQATFKKFYGIISAMIEEKMNYFDSLSKEDQGKISSVVVSHLASEPVIKAANNALTQSGYQFVIPWLMREAKMSNMSGVTPGVALYWLAKLGLVRMNSTNITMAYGAGEIYESNIWHFMVPEKARRQKSRSREYKDILF